MLTGPLFAATKSALYLFIGLKIKGVKSDQFLRIQWINYCLEEREG